MDTEKKYAAFSIPRRETPPETGVPARERTRPAEVSFTDAPFAEIEYDPSVGSAFRAPAQPIAPKRADPIREKFYAMRSLASGIPFARNDPALFYRQAKFMEDFADDYRGSAQFFMYYPCYQHMGYEQLRTYFTWRARARRGEFLPVSLSYVLLYVYELLSSVGVADAADGLARLMAVWSAYRERERALDDYLPGWIKDYHVYYALPGFVDFAREHGLEAHYPDLFLFDPGARDGFALWCAASSYDVLKSKFYNGGNGALTRDCFSAVLGGIRALCESRNRRVEDLLMAGVHRGAAWTPFAQALFYPWLRQGDRRAELSDRERYFCRGNRWTADLPVPDPDRREVAGYLMKKTEACLRRAVRYKFQLTANPAAFCNLPYKLGRLGITQAELDAAIESAVAEFHRGLNRTVVVVNRENLDRIRLDALMTQDKLIVPEEDEPAPPLDECAPPDARPGQGFDGWCALKAALSGVELRALALILRGGAEIRSFADENGVMLEVLADSINEKAADCIGDAILEFGDGMAVYGEYREKIAEMV